MPNTKSAEKALRQTIRRRKRNIKKKKDLKETIKQYKKLISDPNASGQDEKIKQSLSLVYKKLDKAAKVNLIKKNKANRLKSRLTKKIKKTNTSD
ncbi:30S ribosomal protein S20 [Candidatus Wolfebacteria bacterium]|nr:30S ribosomal protein S20 [Candidatus Wolfebacteria bacterium]